MRPGQHVSIFPHPSPWNATKFQLYDVGLNEKLTMTNYNFWFQSPMVWLVLVLALLSAASAADQPPNIIFILADDLVRLHFFYFFSCKNVLGGGLLLLSVKHLPTSQHLILVVLLLKTTEIKAFAICYFGYPAYYNKTIWLGYLYFEKHDFHSLHFCNSSIRHPSNIKVLRTKIYSCEMHFAVFSSDSQTHFTEASRYLHCENFQKNLGQKKNGSSSLKQCNFSPKENKMQNKTKQKQTTEKQTNKLRQGWILLFMLL